MKRRVYVLIALAAAGCAAPSEKLGFALAPTTAARGTIAVSLAPDRSVTALARSWHGSDVFEYDLDLKSFDPVQNAFVDAPTPRTTTLPQLPTPQTQAKFGDLTPGQRYEVTVVARGNTGGTAPDQILNADTPATAEVDVGATATVVAHTLPVPLDAVPFGLTLQLPSNVNLPGSIPAWATGLDATLADAAASATPLLAHSYLPTDGTSFVNVRGNKAYALAVTIHSLTGQTTVRLPNYQVPLVDGTDEFQTPAFPPFVPPTGTIIATYTVGASSFGLAIDALDHVWVTIQHSNTVAEIDASGTALIPQVAVGSTPRGIAVDKVTGDVWVTEASVFGNVDRISSDGTLLGHFSAGLVPAAVAVDAQHRPWVTDALSGTVHVTDTSGNGIPGSPFAVGSRPATIAIDSVTGDGWIVNTSSNDVSKVSATGVVSGPFATGTTPGGVAIAPDHTIWVACNGDSTMHHYKPDGSAASATINLGGGPSVMSIDQGTGDMWVSLLSGNVVAKLKADGTLVGRYSAGTFPAGMDIDSQHHLWLTGNGLVEEIAP